MTKRDSDILRLIARSPSDTDGWRNVSDRLWPIVKSFGIPELIEINEYNRQVRLTVAGLAVVKYSL